MDNACQPAITCEDLSIAVPGRRLVDGLDLEVRAGEILAVLGPNGVGKSLTLHALAGLVPAAGGRVLLGGRALAD